MFNVIIINHLIPLCLIIIFYHFQLPNDQRILHKMVCKSSYTKTRLFRHFFWSTRGALYTWLCAIHWRLWYLSCSDINVLTTLDRWGMGKTFPHSQLFSVGQHINTNTSSHLHEKKYLFLSKIKTSWQKMTQDLVA